MDMQEAYAGADIGRLEEHLAEAQRTIAMRKNQVDRLQREREALEHRIEDLESALKWIEGLNDNPARYNADIDAVIRRVLY